MNIKLEFIGRNHVAADIWQLHFKKPRGFIFTAGQYLEVTVDDPNPDERGNQRWFTISASPTQADIIITTRLVEQHSEFKDDLFGLKPGDTLDAKGPMGDFVLPAKSANILWIAGVLVLRHLYRNCNIYSIAKSTAVISYCCTVFARSTKSQQPDLLSNVRQ